MIYEIYRDADVLILASYPKTAVPQAGETVLLDVFVADPDNDTADFAKSVKAVGKVLSEPESWSTTPGQWREFGRLMHVEVKNMVAVYR